MSDDGGKLPSVYHVPLCNEGAVLKTIMIQSSLLCIQTHKFGSMDALMNQMFKVDLFPESPMVKGQS